MSKLLSLSAVAATRAIRKGELKAEELARAYLERIAQEEPRLRAFVHLDPEGALEQARRLDRQSGPREGELYGVPVAVKEIFDVRGLRCSWGTPIHRNRVPERDARAVERLRIAGAVIVGTTVSTEYAIAAAGPTVNPHDPARTPGGSSSGSAAAVAAGLVPLALGSQTLGSVVRPATYCGVYGLKPTRGAISTAGVMPLSPFLDHVGILARCVEDIAAACRALFGRDPQDPYSAPVAAPVVDQASAPRRVLLVEGPLRQRIQAPTRAALERAASAFESAAVAVEARELPEFFQQAEACAETLLCYGLARAHGGERDRFGEQMSERLRALIDRGRGISEEAYRQALAQAEKYRQALIGLLGSDAVILAPATDSVAPPLSEGTGSPALQGLWTLAGLPALAVPCGQHQGLPIGVQLVAAPGRESLVLAAAQLLARDLGH